LGTLGWKRGVKSPWKGASFSPFVRFPSFLVFLVPLCFFSLLVFLLDLADEINTGKVLARFELTPPPKGKSIHAHPQLAIRILKYVERPPPSMDEAGKGKKKAKAKVKEQQEGKLLCRWKPQVRALFLPLRHPFFLCNVFWRCILSLLCFGFTYLMGRMAMLTTNTGKTARTLASSARQAPLPAGGDAGSEGEVLEG
jgi:hypothetical protein